MSKLKDGGTRKVFDTGSMREIDETKGRCDLVYNFAWSHVDDDDYFYRTMEQFVREGNENLIYNMIKTFIQKYYDSYETAYLEVSKQYADGAAKYKERDMEKGAPMHCYVDSALRHYTKFKRGDKDEPHDRAFIWNLLTLLYMVYNHPECNDLPFKGGE